MVINPENMKQCITNAYQKIPKDTLQRICASFKKHIQKYHGQWTLCALLNKINLFCSKYYFFTQL